MFKNTTVIIWNITTVIIYLSCQIKYPMNKFDILSLTRYPGNGRKNSTRGDIRRNNSKALVVFLLPLSGFNFLNGYV